jgi:hypothetical protein
MESVFYPLSGFAVPVFVVSIVLEAVRKNPQLRE